jgi:hypothetical protein
MSKATSTLTPVRYDQLSAIIAYEQGRLDEEGTIELFQSLVTSGLAWKLQGHYGRTAAALINLGLVAVPPLPCKLCGQIITDRKPCGCGARR